MLDTFGSVLLLAVTIGSPMESLSRDSTSGPGRLIDSLRAEPGVLSVWVTPRRELIYSVTVNGEHVLATGPLPVSAVESWAEIAADLVPTERPGRTARPVSVPNALIIGQSSSDPQQFVLLVSDGSRETGVAFDSAGVRMLIEASRAAVLAAEGLSDDELLLDSPVKATLAKLRFAPPYGPLYPANLRARGIQGHVIARVLVDSKGRAVRNSIVIVGATDPAFGEAVRLWLQRASFNPATLEGRIVHQRITVPVTFTISP